MKKHFLSAILFVAGVLLCSCKMNLLQDGANIKISLPYGSARAAGDTKYSFKIDCFTGSEITDSPAYSQDSESGKEILFKDVIPSVYTVRVRAFEYNNFDNLLYEGQDTKNVVEGAVTNFLITMNKLKFKGNIKNLNTVYLQYHVADPTNFDFMREGKIEAKTICENGVTPVNYDWYFGDLYLKTLSGSDKNIIDLQGVEKYLREIGFNQGDTNLFYMVIVKFSNGNYANYSFNNYLEMIVEEFYDDGIFNEERYNAFLMTAKPVPKYTKSDKSSKGTIKYTYSFNDAGEFSHEEMSSNISFYKIDGEFPESSDYWTKGTLVPNQDELIFEYTRDLPEDYYIVKIGLFQSGNYFMDCYDMIYVQNGYITEAAFKDGMYFGDPGQGGGGTPEPEGVTNLNEFCDALSAVKENYQTIYIKDTIVIESMIELNYTQPYVISIERSSSLIDKPMFCIKDSFNFTAQNEAVSFSGCNFETSAPIFYIDGGALRLGSTDSKKITIQNNKNSKDGIYGDGGAISTSNSSGYLLELVNVYMNNNTGKNGGAIYLSSSPEKIVISSCSFMTNKALDKGGALYVNVPLGSSKNDSFENMKISASIFTSNSASTSGGAIYVETGDLYFSGNNSFNNNNADSYGGGIYVADGTTSSYASENTLFVESTSTAMSNNSNTAGIDGSFVYFINTEITDDAKKLGILSADASNPNILYIN